MNDSLQNAISTFPIASWISSHADGAHIGAKYIRLNCPACGGRETLSVSLHKKTARCFKCIGGGLSGWRGSGDLVDLVSLILQCDYRAAITEIMDNAGLADLVVSARVSEARPSKLLPDCIIKVSEAWELHPCRKKLIDRKLSHMEDRIYVCVEGMYRGRWILPCWQFGKLEGFEAKTFVGAKPPSLFPEWFRTGECIYTTPKWDRAQDWCVITESIYDAETLETNAIGIFGSTLYDGQLFRLLEMRRLGIRKLVWFLDSDAARKQRAAIIKKTGLLFENYIVEIPAGSPKDPNDLGSSTAWELVRAARKVESAFDLYGHSLCEV